MPKITAKVAKILDNRTLVINAGSDKNVRLGMKFLISSSVGSEVKDPDSEEVLGEVAIPKIRVSIVRVDSKYSIAETFEYQTINEGGSIPTSMTLTKIFEPPKLVKRYKTFELEESQKRSIDEEKSVVKVGDIAEEIEE